MNFQYNLMVIIMNRLGTSFKLDKNLLKGLLLFIFISFLISFLLFNKIDNSSIISQVSNITEYLNNQNINYILIHFIIISVLLTCSFTIVGIIIFPIYLLYEILTINYSIFIFVKVFHFSGFIYGLIYNILTKSVFIILLFMLFKKIINIYKKFILKEDDKSLSYSINKNLKAILTIIIGILLNDLLIYLISSKILLKLAFIIS